MKRIITLFFLFTFLTANIAFGEVWKLPVLVQHYGEHEALQGNISFLDFLKEHYTDPNSHSDLPYHHHDNLPLKTLNIYSTSVVCFIPNFGIGEEQILFESTSHNVPLYQEGNFINNYLSQIWQPPRI